MDRLEAAKYIKDHCLGSEVYRDGTTWNDAMVTAVEVLEGKDTNVHTNSALDHIHNVVKDDAYRRGYKQAKEDCIKAVRDCYENILDVETDGHTIADSVEDIITERVRE